jgi:hypothetical protein
VFATTGSVVDEMYEGRRFQRHNAVIEEFNATAIKALEGTDTVINDLYAHSRKAPMACRSDAVHFNTDEGRAYMGKKVLSVICKELDIPVSEVKTEDSKPEEYSAENIGY